MRRLLALFGVLGIVQGKIIYKLQIARLSILLGYVLALAPLCFVALFICGHHRPMQTVELKLTANKLDMEPGIRFRNLE
jgi:hypothetical protein